MRADKSSDFTSDEIDSLDKIGRLSKFVTPSKYLSDMRKSKKRKVDAIKDVSAYFSMDFSRVISDTNMNKEESQRLNIVSSVIKCESQGDNKKCIDIDRSPKGFNQELIGVKTRSSDARYQSNSTNYRAKVVKYWGSAVNGSQKQVRTEDISKAKHSFEKESNVPSELLLHDSNIKNKYKVIEEMIVNYEDNNNDIIFPAKVSMESKKEMLEFVKNHSPRLSCMKITGIRSPSSRQEFIQKELLIFKLSLERLMQRNIYRDCDIVDGHSWIKDK